MSGASTIAQKERLVEFDYLRGMAIAMIVLGHSIFLSQPVFPALLENLLRGGTGLFVFISGFFFHRVFYPRFHYTDFIRKKARLLLIPFVIISLFALAIRMLGWWQDGLNIQQNLLNAWYTLRNGYVLYPHWYIPFIFLTFLCSPLHAIYIRTPLSIQIFVLLTFSLIALLMHRPQSNSNFLQSLVYFTPYYLLGILFSQYEKPLRRFHWPLLYISVAVIATTALVQTYVLVHLGNYHKAPFTYEGWDLQFIQILFGCIAMLALCRHIRPWLQQHLCWLAELSFPIFFIHPLLTIALENIAALDAIKLYFPVTSIAASLFVFTLVFLIQFYGSAGVALVIQKVFKKHSKLIVG
ncbi:acyltransferase [Cellvibrio sp. pealriver]|uniref:acyltransferase family protein n=1 Tax=Cellvibrio sp. pealriver TaxID=1622269 RepID=UPI00066FCC60|nr:acyltransferase [Cellvibrio sp. pealriver]